MIQKKIEFPIVMTPDMYRETVQFQTQQPICSLQEIISMVKIQIDKSYRNDDFKKYQLLIELRDSIDNDIIKVLAKYHNNFLLKGKI